MVMIPGAKSSFQAAQGNREFVQDPRPRPGLCQVVASPHQISHGTELFIPHCSSLQAQLPTLSFLLLPPGAARPLPLEMAIALFFLKMPLCCWPGLFFCFVDCKGQRCSFEMQRAPFSSCPWKDQECPLGGFNDFNLCTPNPQESPGWAEAGPGLLQPQAQSCSNSTIPMSLDSPQLYKTNPKFTCSHF